MKAVLNIVLLCLCLGQAGCGLLPSQHPLYPVQGPDNSQSTIADSQDVEAPPLPPGAENSAAMAIVVGPPGLITNWLSSRFDRNISGLPLWAYVEVRTNLAGPWRTVLVTNYPDAGGLVWAECVAPAFTVVEWRPGYRFKP